MGASPGAAVALTQMNAEIDVRNVLSSIRVPSLVIHRTDDQCLKVEEGRFVADRFRVRSLLSFPETIIFRLSAIRMQFSTRWKSF
jgi:pimeloyl-ACP methyl ester carboxylesterase